MKMFRKNEGFTLIELMVVVLIIGILVAIAIPVFNAAQANAKAKTCQANQRTITGAANTYRADNTNFPAAIADLSPTYIKAVPVCPGTSTVAAGGVYAWDAVNGTVTGDGKAGGGFQTDHPLP